MHQFASIALSFGLIFFYSISAAATNHDEGCPPNLALEAGERLVQLEVTQNRLADFVSGSALTGTPVTALFIVDLNNEEAIQSRIKEFLALQEKHRPSVELTDAYLACAKNNSALEILVNKVKDRQLLIDRQRLEFLSLPPERRNSLINSQISRQQQAETAVRFAEEKDAADKLQNEAAISIATAEEQAKSAASSDLREIAAQRAILEKTRETLGRLQAETVSGLQERAEYYKKTSEKLSALAALTMNRNKSKSLPDAYWESVKIWRELVDLIFERIAAPVKAKNVPDIPKVPSELLDRLNTVDEAAQYQIAYQETEALKSQLKSSSLERFEKERADLYRLLLDAGKLRSVLLKDNLSNGHDEILDVSTDYFKDVGREMRIVPYQVLAIFYSKAIDFRQKASSGVTGWLNIANQSFIFFLFVTVLFAAFTGLNRVSSYLNRLRSYLVREKYSQAYARSLAIWIRRGNAYVPWTVMLIGVNIAQDLVADTDIAQIGLFLPYIAYYLWYRIFLNLVLSILGLIAFSDAIRSTEIQKDRLHRTVKLVGVFFFVLLAILHATEDAVGEALVYRIVYGLVVYVGILICAYAAHEWRQEISRVSKQLLPERIYLAIDTLSSSIFWSWFVSLPALVLVIFTKFSIYIKRWAGEFDFFKKISAAIFLRRIEHANKTSGLTAVQQPQLPNEYLQWFKLDVVEDKSLLINPGSKILSEIEMILTAWSDNTSLDHSLALFGERGSGKSSLFDMIEIQYSKCAIRRISIPPKLTTREAVLSFFGKELGMDLNNGNEALLQAESNFPDTVLLIDNAQNLFLGELGGFEGYRTFAELMNSGTDHLFWCVAINLRSWHYLRAVFGGMPLFRKAIEIHGFSETDIMNLVMARHRHSNTQLAYDDIIRATQSEDDFIGEHQVEKQFFRLLWGQSNGNPRAALMLWTASLSPLGGNRLKVGLPKYPKIIFSKIWGDEALFVYAAIIRHENLTAREVISVTNLTENIVNNALDTGHDNNLLSYGSDGRYRITATAQFNLIQHLLGKNFIYE